MTKTTKRLLIWGYGGCTVAYLILRAIGGDSGLRDVELPPALVWVPLFLAACALAAAFVIRRKRLGK